MPKKGLMVEVGTNWNRSTEVRLLFISAASSVTSFGTLFF